jgi:YesN/AraC family two-component response regulator
MSRCLLFDLVSTMIKSIDEIKDEKDCAFIENLNPVERLLSCDTAERMKQQMLEILERICRYIEVNKKSHNVELRDSIMNYIKNNYQDVNLNVAKIAQEFDLNPSYLSRFFKEQVGTGLLDYINKFRIEKAKEFLPNVIVCDIGLPDINGYEVARRILRCNELKGSRLISLSGYAQASDFEDSAQAGFDLHISKPVDFENLKTILDSIAQ